MPEESTSTRSGADVGGGGSLRANGTIRVPPRKRLKVSHDPEEETEKVGLLAQKQAELKQVLSRHDDLVRERYHMTHVKGILDYQPAEARKDNSEGFQRFKQTKFFLNDAALSSSSRRTRQAMSEQKLADAVPTCVPSHRSSGHDEVYKDEIGDIIRKAQEKRKALLNREELEPEIQMHPGTSASAPVPKRAGKASSSISDTKSTPSEQSLSIRVARRPTVKPGALEPIKTRSATPAAGEPSNDTDAALLYVAGFDSDLSSLTDLSSGEEEEREVVSMGSRTGSDRKENSSNVPGEVSNAPTSSSRKGRFQKGKKKARKEAPPVSHPPSPQVEPSTDISLPPTHVKRVTLTIRKPPPTYTNFLQIPPPPFYNGSLTQMLKAFKTTGGKEVNGQTYRKKLQSETALRNKEYAFRLEGRFIPGTDVLFGTKLDIDTPLPTPYEPPSRTTTDHWDTVVEAVIATAKSKPSRSKKGSFGQQVAKQVASCVQGYWAAQNARNAKSKLQEEKRLRTLAKSTIKEVVAAWKQAVFHVREQERLKEEAEERKRGQEHLDAILSQSGQLLSSQQTDLFRSSNRGLDAPSEGDSDDDDELVEEDEGGSPQNDDDADATSEGAYHADDDDDGDITTDAGEGEEMGTSMLLANNGKHIADSLSEYLSKGDEEEEETDAIEKLLFTDSDSPISGLSSPALSSHPFQSEAKGTRVSSSSPPPIALAGKAMTNGHDAPSLYPMNGESPSLLQVPPDEPVDGRAGAGSPNHPPNTSNDEGDVHSLSKQMEQATLSNKAPTESLEGSAQEESDVETEDDLDGIPEYLRPYAVAPVQWDPSKPVSPPALLRGTLRPYQQVGLEWLANLHTSNLNGILADEMGLGKTIQTIALLAHLACDRGIWGPHLIVVPTSVLLNWEMEFKKFLPGFKVLSYHGSPQRRKELRKGWSDKHSFNVCITSYTLAARDQALFKRRNWYYMILDEAHMIKNFRSQRWNTLLMFRSFRRLLLTGTPLQNNLTELWALLQFLMSGSDFANLKEFGDWFSNPLEKAIEMGEAETSEALERVSKLHTVLRPYLLRRLKRDVEKELPSKFEHLVLCPLSKRQRFLYDEFMSRAQTQNDLHSGVYLKIANILMQLRKVCNHPDLFEVRPIVTSFAMSKSAIADFEIKELLVRKRWCDGMGDLPSIDAMGLQFVRSQSESHIASERRRSLDATSQLPFFGQPPAEPPPKNTRTMAGFRLYTRWLELEQSRARWSRIHSLNLSRCQRPDSIICTEAMDCAKRCYKPLLPLSCINQRSGYLDNIHPTNAAILSYSDREAQMAPFIDRFAFATPAVLARDLPLRALAEQERRIQPVAQACDRVLRRAAVKLSIAFPDPTLLQFDCGKLQRLAELLKEKKAGGHRVLIFTQMTRVLDILETFLSLHGYLYLRLDGSTKIEDRQYVTERFNVDQRVFCFIASSRSGGVGINLTGADTVVFYDSDFNPQMDRQCEDRAHRIGQIRDVHIYRFVSEHTVEEAMLRKANQKRSLDDMVIQKGHFDWGSLLEEENNAFTRALGDCDDVEDADAATLAAKEACAVEGVDEGDFEDLTSGIREVPCDPPLDQDQGIPDDGEDDEEEEEEGGTTVDYMVAFVERDWDFFGEWRV
ncbi:helicase SWR1 [Coprinopsis sp. MPI-PUGE-AT-0042]|nr:helicase SWR1 [Coprinopsis sp. MPI-PUGE-AT-0042]